MALYALRKQNELVGRTPQHQYKYIQQKGQLITKLQREVNTKTHALDKAALWSITNLAACALQDGELDATKVHLTALRRMNANRRITSLEWMGFWCLDLQFALIMGQHPMLPYYIPPNRRAPNLTGFRSQGSDLARRCAAMIPLLEDGSFGLPQAHRIFLKSFQLFLALSHTDHVDSLGNQSSYLYDFEYELRTVHASILLSPKSPQRNCVALLLLATQLSFWVGARFWEPVGSCVRSHVLVRAYQLISSTPSLCDSWLSSGGHPSSLLWALATFAAFALDGHGTLPLTALVEVAQISELTTRGAFLEALEQWPWLDSWHRARYDKIWDEMVAWQSCEPSGGDDDHQASGIPAIESLRGNTSCRLFLGVMEFYNP